MKPALTKEEWDRQRGLVYDVGPEREWSGRPHGLAALCLHGQPFGFTREDVKVLSRASEYALRQWGPVVAGQDIAMLSSLADRIEALLPPEESK